MHPQALMSAAGQIATHTGSPSSDSTATWEMGRGYAPRPMMGMRRPPWRNATVKNNKVRKIKKECRPSTGHTPPQRRDNTCTLAYHVKPVLSIAALHQNSQPATNKQLKTTTRWSYLLPCQPAARTGPVKVSRVLLRITTTYPIGVTISYSAFMRTCGCCNK